jgi:hypothetical protein
MIFKLFFGVSFFICITNLFGNSPEMKIILKASPQIGGNEVLLFEGSKDMDIINLLKKARRARNADMIKDALIEGSYIIEFYNGAQILKYSVDSNYLVFDITSNNLLKCSLTKELHRYLIGYLFRKGIIIPK